MKYATIFLILALAFACQPDQPVQMSAGKAKLAVNHSPNQVVAVKMIDNETGALVGTALVPKELAYEYRHITFYDGVLPGPGVDFDIVEVPLREGGDTYLLCIRE